MRVLITAILVLAFEHAAFACDIFVENTSRNDLQMQVFDVQRNKPLMNQVQRIQRNDGIYVQLPDSCGDQLRVEFSDGSRSKPYSGTFSPARERRGVPVYQIP